MLAGAATLGLAAAAGLDTANAAEIEPQALEYLQKRGYSVRARGSVMEILDRNNSVARLAPTPRFSESGLGSLPDRVFFHTIQLKNPEKCRPFLVAQLGALKQILILPTDGVSEIKRTGVYHRFYFEDSLGLVGILGHARSGYAHQINEETGAERRITDPAALDMLSRSNVEDERSLEKMPNSNCVLIS